MCSAGYSTTITAAVPSKAKVLMTGITDIHLSSATAPYSGLTSCSISGASVTVAMHNDNGHGVYSYGDIYFTITCVYYL